MQWEIIFEFLLFGQFIVRYYSRPVPFTTGGVVLALPNAGFVLSVTVPPIPWLCGPTPADCPVFVEVGPVGTVSPVMCVPTVLTRPAVFAVLSPSPALMTGGLGPCVPQPVQAIKFVRKSRRARARRIRVPSSRSPSN